ncbi:MAG: CheR family methyltransferase [Polyangiaceae bacterium]
MSPALVPVTSLDPELEDLEVDLLLEGLFRRYGLDFRGYARPSLVRRIRSCMAHEGAETISMLADKLLHDPSCAARTVGRLTVHTTSMFRDAEFFHAFRTKVVPLLRTYPFVRIWHAGCSTGEEVLSLAIVLAEEGLSRRCRTYATDLSVTHLERARLGICSLEHMRDTTARYRKSGGREELSRYFVADERSAAFSRRLLDNVVFSQHDLVTGGSFNDFHVILCRNVMIYFGSNLRDRVLGLFRESLVRFGILGLGKRENLALTPFSSRFAEMMTSTRLYRATA